MIPPLPDFIFSIVAFLLEYLEVVRQTLPPPLPPPIDVLVSAVVQFVEIISQLHVPVHTLISQNYDGYPWVIQEQSIWNNLVVRPGNFWLLTGETPGSLSRVVQRIGGEVEARVRDPWNPRRRLVRTRPYVLCLHDRILLTFLWLRNYQTLTTLSQQFGISVSNVYDIIYTIVPILHEHYYRRYVAWHNEEAWEGQRNEFQEFPNAVGAIDALAVQINRPQGQAQRMYYRRDRGFHFLNFQVVVDNDGYFQFVRGGFLGHATDADSFARLPAIGYQRQLHLPRGAYLLADGGYPAAEPLLTPFRRPRGGRLNLVRYRANVELGRARVRVEHRIGDVRVYRSVPGRAGRFRARREFVCVVVRVAVAFTNRRRMLIRAIINRFAAI